MAALTDAEYQQIKARYDLMSKFFTEARLTMFRSIPGIQRIGDGPDGKSVELGYYCPPGEAFDAALIRQEILASEDIEGTPWPRR